MPVYKSIVCNLQNILVLKSCNEEGIFSVSSQYYLVFCCEDAGVSRAQTLHKWCYTLSQCFIKTVENIVEANLQSFVLIFETEGPW